MTRRYEVACRIWSRPSVLNALDTRIFARLYYITTVLDLCVYGLVSEVPPEDLLCKMLSFEPLQAAVNVNRASSGLEQDIIHFYLQMYCQWRTVSI